MDVKRLFPLSGIVFVALVVVTIAIGGSTPSSDAAASKVASFYDEHTVGQAILTFVLAASVPFLVFFGIAMADGDRSPEGRRSAWNYVAAAGAILAGGAILATAFVHFALVDAGDHNVSPTALLALNSLDGNTWIAFNSAFGVMMLGASGVFLSAAGRQRWLGWVALVLGIALFIPFADFIALLLTLVWIVVTSVVLARGGAEARHTLAASTT